MEFQKRFESGRSRRLSDTLREFVPGARKRIEKKQIFVLLVLALLNDCIASVLVSMVKYGVN